MKQMTFLFALVISISSFAAKEAGNGGDSTSIQFKDIGNTIVAQLRFAEKKNKLKVDPKDFKKALDQATVESTNTKLFLNGKRKDAINYPASQRIIIYSVGWRQLSIQDKRTLVLHEILGLLEIDDSRYQISTNLESVASVEVVPYFAGKDEDCIDSNHKPLPGEIYEARLANIVVISDIYSKTDREIYCTVSVETSDKVQRKFSASFSENCRRLFTQKENVFKLRVVGDHICEIMNKLEVGDEI